MRTGVRPGLQILRVCLWWTGRFDSDTLPPALSPKVAVSYRVILDEFTKAETFPSQQGSQAPSADRDWIASAHPKA